jgi:hypothetical protein
MLDRLLRLLGLRRRTGERITQPVPGEELAPWGLWLTADPERELLVVNVLEESDHHDAVKSHLGRIGGKTGLLVFDAVSYSFARDWPGRTDGTTLVTFGSRADVVERTHGTRADGSYEDERPVWAETIDPSALNRETRRRIERTRRKAQSAQAPQADVPNGDTNADAPAEPH